MDPVRTWLRKAKGDDGALQRQPADHGIVNRMRNRPDRHGREFELGLRISPGMSGGPVFNDRGEVIAVSTFVRYLQPGGQQGPILDKSSHAIAVDALRELLPLPW